MGSAVRDLRKWKAMLWVVVVLVPCNVCIKMGGDGDGGETTWEAQRPALAACSVPRLHPLTASPPLCCTLGPPVQLRAALILIRSCAVCAVARDRAQAPGGLEALFSELGHAGAESAAALAFLSVCVKDHGAVGQAIELLRRCVCV